MLSGMYRAIAIVLALGLAANAAAQVYKRTLPDGTVQYSDRPFPDSKEVKLAPLQTYESQGVPESAENSSASSAPPEFPGYEDFKVASPAHDATIRDNGGSVGVSLSVSPGLQPGHTVEILMNGKVLGSGKSLSLTLTNVDRGTHRIEAVIKDADGKQVARAQGATFHLKRQFRRNNSGS